MKILSLFPNHNSAVCLLEDGEVILNWEQERHTRVRHDYGFDDEFIRLCLELVRWDPQDIDVLCVNHDKHLAARIEQSRGNPPMDIPGTEAEFVRGFQTVLFGRRFDAYAINHHLAHAASAYYTSPNDHCAILTFDGGGDGANISFSVGNGGKIDKFISKNVPYLALWWDGMSVGNFGYRPIHEMDPGSAAGKIMALAAYGELEEPLRNALVGEMEQRKIRQHPIYSDQGIYVFDNFRDFSDTSTPLSQDLAKCLQSITETELEKYFELAYEHGGGGKNLCYAGGIALNCVATSVAAKNSRFSSVHVPPCPHDGGLALGMALFLYHQVFDHSWTPKFFSPYTGPEWPADSVASVLQNARAEGHEVKEVVADDIGDLLIEGKILGVCRGKSECGPRALGHRSIICRPDLPEIRDRLNTLKRREWYRPFAPIVLDEFAQEVLEEVRWFSPYMSFAETISSKWLKSLEGVRHIDDSTRPQILTKQSDPYLYQMIKRQYSVSGIPAVLNTSFNCQEPIVETPENAYLTFKEIGLDALILGDYLISELV